MFSKKLRIIGLAGSLLAAVCTAALAADNYYLVPSQSTATGATKFRSVDTGTNGQMPLHGIGDATGTQYSDGNGLPVRVMSQPAGSPTSANQVTGNTSLSALVQANGGPSDSAWDGSATSASQISILKSIRLWLASVLSVDTVQRSVSADRGGVLATANTAVTLVNANTSRRGLAIQNRNPPSSTYNAATSVFMNCTTTATQDFHSLEIVAGAFYDTPPHHVGTGACSFVSATANTPVYVREF